MKRTLVIALLLLFSINAIANECPAGYEWDRMSGVGCIQSNCNDIADAHYSYTGRCVCGSSGSIEENPSDPNKECYSDSASCKGCVVACVHLDEDCPGEKPASTPVSTAISGDDGSWADDWGSGWDDYPEDYGDSGEEYGEWDYGGEDETDIGSDIMESLGGIASLEWLNEIAETFNQGEKDEKMSAEIDPNYVWSEEGFDSILDVGVEEEFDESGFGSSVKAEMNPFEFPGGSEIGEAQDYVLTKWRALKDWYQGDLPLTGEDGMWNWKSVHIDEETGERVEIKWIGGDVQLGWNKGFKLQVYFADVSMPGSKGTDGYTVGLGVSAEWKDKFKLSIGVPGTPVSLNIVPRDIGNWISDGIEGIRDTVRQFDLIKASQDYQRRQAQNN